MMSLQKLTTKCRTTVDNIEDLLLSTTAGESGQLYSLASYFVNKVYKSREAETDKKIVMITFIVVIAAIVIGVVLWFLRDRKVQRTEDMNYHLPIRWNISIPEIMSGQRRNASRRRNWQKS